MTRREALGRLFDGMRADMEDYRVLRGLLEEQFVAALGHRTEEIGLAVERILTVTTTLKQRSRERVQLAAALAGGKVKRVTMRAVSARLPPQTRQNFDARWSVLEGLVQECKRLNARNGHLLMTQREIMQRVLNTEVDTYAPAVST